MTTPTATENNSKEFLYASAVLLKLYKAKVISRLRATLRAPSRTR